MNESLESGEHVGVARDVVRTMPPVVGHDQPPHDPPWSEGPPPPLEAYMESEIAVAGAISTLPPLDQFHPQWALPIARAAIDGLMAWEPTDG